ncbi:MAG TPA: uracil-DNA glycosylase [Cryomorphaceae bacterium]|nr:uracil-DNA glycosylase [Cryomorphaceae bacterium]
MRDLEKRIPAGWRPVVEEELCSPYFGRLDEFIAEEYRTNTVFPARPDVFRAMELTPFDEVKVVVVGQDPYHGPGQADGLSFSVRAGTVIPPSLRNILEEVKRDLGETAIGDGDLTPWSKQGVLLLNAVLTVREGQAGSHRSKGWERFTDAILKKLGSDRSDLVFMLWGNSALSKKNLIDANNHLILTSTHPSPLSVYRGFRGNGHFGKANEFLRDRGKSPIRW